MFSRYANPFLFVDSLMKSNSLSKGLLSIFQIKDDELIWQMYCSLLANPMSKIKSFKQVKNDLLGGNTSKTDTNVNDLHEKEVKDIANKSADILNKFKPH